MRFRRISFTLLLVAGASVSSPAQFSDPNYAVTVASGIKYGEGELSAGPNLNLTLDIYTPIESTNTYRPCLLIVHGGGWSSGSKTDINQVEFANYFAERGFVTASINYRKVGDSPPNAPQTWYDTAASFGLSAGQAHASYAAIVDTGSAIRFLRANANTYGINPDRIFALGSSAGAFNVLHAGLDDPSFFLSALPVNNLGVSSALALVIDFWGGMLRPGNITAADPPVLIVHGTNDATVPYTAATALSDSLTAAGVFSDFVTLPGAGHGPWNAIFGGKNLRQIAHEFVNANGDIGFDPDIVHVNFGGGPGGGSLSSPFHLLYAAVSAANPSAEIRLASGDSSETFTGSMAVGKPLTLNNSTPGSGTVRIGVSSSRSAKGVVRSGFVSRGARE